MVGYCKPPTITRFQKGKSGNPRGRPKEAKDKLPAISPDCLEFAQTPHRWRRRSPGARVEQFSVFTDMYGIDLIGLVAPQLRPREVADLTPSILVRIQVPQPGILLKSLR
jgi:hypothetical protein